MGEPLQIVEIDENQKLKLVEENFKKIEISSEYNDCKVCILSVAGAFRKGKSFLLNLLVLFFLNNGLNDDDWVNKAFDNIKGKENSYFKWSGGVDRITSGIWIWNKPIVFNQVLKIYANFFLLFIKII